jgi:hypothetical protein
MVPSRSREHRLRVLENQAKLAAGRGASSEGRRVDPQLKMPLIVEVKPAEGTKQRARRPRGKSRGEQSDFGDL